MALHPASIAYGILGRRAAGCSPSPWLSWGSPPAAAACHWLLAGLACRAWLPCGVVLLCSCCCGCVWLQVLVEQLRETGHVAGMLLWVVGGGPRRCCRVACALASWMAASHACSSSSSERLTHHPTSRQVFPLGLLLEDRLDSCFVSFTPHAVLASPFMLALSAFGVCSSENAV